MNGYVPNNCSYPSGRTGSCVATCYRYVDDFFGVDPAGCEYTGGFCLTQICSLLGFATDPKKVADNAVNLAILGAKFVVDVAPKTVAAAVDEKKAATWSATLESIFESNMCSPDQAAECAGRLGFACAIASGKIGRAFVKRFYAQANAPMPGFLASLLLKNAAEWLIKFFSLAPAVKLSMEKKHWRNS